MINTDDQRKILFPSNFKGISVQQNYDIPFYILETKFKYDFSIAMYYLKKNYDFSLLDFKFYRPNFITKYGYINHYQKVHRDSKVKIPNIMVKLKSSSTDKKEASSTNKKETSKLKKIKIYSTSSA